MGCVCICVWMGTIVCTFLEVFLDLDDSYMSIYICKICGKVRF